MKFKVVFINGKRKVSVVKSSDKRNLEKKGTK
ncbi:Uncharacterised protein [Clostridium perfringens]|uniref:Uncharacterized protein n=1 Tax=Clostridium perfringens TaxID=1502 RepID=A0A2X3BMU3_CLOPF|nr:Uncharacterised protein [Clostridium perfringens]